MKSIADQLVFFGSSENMEDVTSDSVDFIMTSPPYWNLKKYGGPNEIGQSSYEEYLYGVKAAVEASQC